MPFASGLATYTNNLLSHIKEVINLKSAYMFYPYHGKTDIYEVKNMPGSLLNGDRRPDFWHNMYSTDWKVDYPIEVFHNTVNGIGLPKNCSGRKVITLHDLIPYIMPETVDRPHLDYTFKYTPYIIEEADHIITVSDFSKSDIQRFFGVDDDKITVTHLAADRIYCPMDRTKAKNVILNKYGVDKRYVLYLGGFSLRKNISRLLISFKRVVDEVDNTLNLLILGEHSKSYKRLWGETETLGLCENVRFINYVPTEDLPFFYNGAEVFVYPSLYEGFGLPPLEAMQCGTPVVTSNVSSIPEIVGDAAIKVNPYSTYDISSSIIQLLMDEALWTKYSLMGIKKSNEYSWNKTAERTLQVYEKCLK